MPRHAASCVLQSTAPPNTGERSCTRGRARRGIVVSGVGQAATSREAKTIKSGFGSTFGKLAAMATGPDLAAI